MSDSDAQVLLRTDSKGEGGETSFDTPSTVQPAPAGCTLEAYAAAKRLPEEFLARLGITQIFLNSAPVLRIPYFDEMGTECAVRFRTGLHKAPDGDIRFRWRKGSKPMLYGLGRLNRSCHDVVLAEGESDAQTLWFHGINAVGLPGAANWNEARDAPHLEPFETIYVICEDDDGGAQLLRWLERSAIRARVRLIELEGDADVSALHCVDPDSFRTAWDELCAEAIPWAVHEARRLDEGRAQAWEACRELAQCPAILEAFGTAIRIAGVVGEERLVKILYLAMTSRVLKRPVSVAVKGPSSGGKSFTTETVLSFFPEEAFHALTAMSERALAYGDEPLKHRMLVIYEAAGMEGDMASYLIRSLLSEDRVRYEFTEKTRDGLKVRLIEREGPTGLIVTTTKTGLHPENETRLLSLHVQDTQEQTRAVLKQLASDELRTNLDRAPWIALQKWLAAGKTAVTIPFAAVLAEHIPPVATRLRRDFRAVRSLIEAHALLHQATRERDDRGRVVATLDDYAVVRDLVGDVVAEGVEASVPEIVRETVEALKAMDDPNGVQAKAIGDFLHIDKSAALRRCQMALKRGYIKNLQEKRGQKARYVPDQPMPDDLTILPEPETLARLMADGCTVDREIEGQGTPSPLMVPPKPKRANLPEDFGKSGRE